MAYGGCWELGEVGGAWEERGVVCGVAVACAVVNR